MYSLLSNICGEHFSAFLSECFVNADTFSLSENAWMVEGNKSEALKIRHRLTPFHVRNIQTSSWFSYAVPQHKSFQVAVFRADPKALSILLEEYQSMFYEDGAWTKPEDICFFKNKKLVVGSSTHERICYVYSNNEGFLRNIEKLGKWEILPDAIEEQIVLSL